MTTTKTKSTAVTVAILLVIAVGIALVAKGYGPFQRESKPAVEVAPSVKEAKHPHADIYQCPMHPQIKSDKPGQCPICGMDLVLVESEDQETPPATAESAASNTPKGFGMVKLAEEKVQMIGVKTTPVVRSSLNRTIRASATVAADERRVKQAQSKVAGWIDKLHVNFVGQYVKKGQPLLAIYSPDLVSAQEEYILAVRNLESLQGALPEIRAGAEDMVEASRRRLRYWDVSQSQISRLEQTGEPSKNLTLFSPAQGYVTETKAVQGMQVEPGMPLFTIVDLSKIWILVSVYAQDSAHVKKGLEVVFHTDVYPGREFVGKVAYINPEFDMSSRSAVVRVELPNPDMELRPGMFGNATLMIETPSVLTAPTSAIMDSGERQIVYVQTEPGHFMPRVVKIGARANDMVEILEGLNEGELVVVEGNFMLDSESRLRATTGESQTGAEHQHPK